jgi:methionyl-tRNA synthetase
MSKTIGNVVDPFALSAEYGADAVRYYLLREIPATDDGDFSRERFEARYAGDLVNGLGNFAARTTALAARAGITPAGNPEDAVLHAVTKARETVRLMMDSCALHEALRAVWDLITFGNQYLNETKPWDKEVQGADKAIAVGNALFILHAVAELLIPFLPDAAAKIQAGECSMLFPRAKIEKA